MQVIIALQAKMRLFADDDVDITISDQSLNADKRAEGLRKTGLFRRVRFIETKAISQSSAPAKILGSLSVIFRNDNIYSRMFWDDDIDYDKVFFFNPGIDVFAAYKKIARFTGAKKIPELVRMEEGVISDSFLTVLDLDNRAKIYHRFCTLTGRRDIVTDTRKYMCFYPELLGIAFHDDRRDYPHIRVPFLTSDAEFLSQLNTVFDYDPSEDSFPQKYIYFSTSADIDGHPVGETELIIKLSEFLGKENLLVKVHPRDGRDVFERAGLPVSRKSTLPWEVIQLNHDFTKHVFVSLSSGSTLNITAMKNENIPVFMLFPMVAGKNKYLDGATYANISKIINGLQSMGVCRSVKITDKLGDVIM